MLLAYGEINFEYEVVILNIDNQGKLSGKCASVRNSSVNEEIYIR
ncbi:hypothetical protein CBE01nite_28340 [Clostridium beijerinckii]|jgi:hypothetical protein|nr:hypothetical protein [Clostridium beijerinckii]NOW33031.1 hypothetical protein [Clostridium beijerinckii]GEP65066.1 hypothetical protein CBE01nite_28340 [Clostridium beijerinckii]